MGRCHPLSGQVLSALSFCLETTVTKKAVIALTIFSSKLTIKLKHQSVSAIQDFLLCLVPPLREESVPRDRKIRQKLKTR